MVVAFDSEIALLYDSKPHVVGSLSLQQSHTCNCINTHNYHSVFDDIIYFEITPPHGCYFHYAIPQLSETFSCSLYGAFTSNSQRF